MGAAGFFGGEAELAEIGVLVEGLIVVVEFGCVGLF